jgi:uncharacterized protein (TIGR02391 family)
MADIDLTRLRGIYARLKGLERSLPTEGVMEGTVARDYQQIIQDLTTTLGPHLDPSPFRLDPSVIYSGGSHTEYCQVRPLRSKVFQTIEYLEMMYHLGRNVVEIGTLYNSIQDEELKARVADLLSAAGNFDRAINQATQVLEDRIRTKAGADKSRTGTDLVNNLIKSKPAETTIKVSDEPGEQEGFSNLCRGAMLAFRNPTHHQITDQFSREDALKICGYVDVLLNILKNASVANKS